jgi:hypothetical protein
MTNPLEYIKVRDRMKYKQGNAIKFNNQKNQIKIDQEIKSSIDKDVNRTYCEVDLFHRDEVRSDLVEVLYIWAKEHPEYGY